MTTTIAPETTPTLSMSPKSLADALAAVKGATSTRSAIVARSGVRIFTSAGVAYVEATDGEVHARKRLDADVSGDLDALVSHADLAKAAKLYAGRESVRLESAPHDGGTDVRATDGKRTIVLSSLRMADFTPFPTGATAPLLYTDRAADLGAVIERAAQFASPDETRPILTGIAFKLGDGETPRVWATDSYRLCDLAAPATPHAGRSGVVNVAARGLVLAAKLMRKSDVPVTMSTLNYGSCVIVEHGTMEWAIRVLDGQYPRFERLIPDTHEVELSVPTAELAGACEVAVAFSRKNAPMRLSVNGSVKVTGSTPDVCEFEEVLASASYVDSGTYMDAYGGEMIVGFNPAFFADIVKAHKSATATLRLITPLRPGLFIDGEDRYLLMPIKLNV